MSWVWQVAITGLVATAVILTMTATLIGYDRIRQCARNCRPRLRAVLPYLVVMLGLLVLRRVTQEEATRLTWWLDLDLGAWIHSIEGSFIEIFQAVQTPELTAVFSFMYLYGYVIVILFPVIAYFCLPAVDHLKELLLAYIVNDSVALVCYVSFIAYGPRNVDRIDFVEPLLYNIHPDAAFVTGSINLNINVFPSMHTSLAVTAFLLAYRTRRIYPIWSGIAGVFATLIVFSTMYLGMHWAIDVLAGIVLAVGAVYIAVWHVQGRPVYGRFTAKPGGTGDNA